MRLHILKAESLYHRIIGTGAYFTFQGSELNALIYSVRVVKKLMLYLSE